MPDASNIYLDDPDPLSVLLTRLELSAEVYVDGAFCGAWAVDTGGSRRIPFHMIGSGAAWLHFDGLSPQPLKSRELVVFPHDSHHVISSSAEAPAPETINAAMSNDGDVTQMVCGFFEFKNPAIFPVLDALPDMVVVKRSGEETNAGINPLVELMLGELAEKRLGSYAAIDQLAFLMFVEILRAQVESGRIKEGLLRALFDTRLGKVLNLIHQYPERPWDIDSLAAQANMSRSSFSEQFTRAVGLSPVKYLTSWRMTEARRLLTSSALSVAQVAEKSGYDSEAAFRKAFKSTLGETPGAVRAASRRK